MTLRQGDTRQRIKREAVRLFVVRGIEAVSVRDIAEAVGMKAPNLYAHFRSRDELVRELFAEGYEAYGAALAAVGGADFPARLEGMLRAVCRLHDEDVVLFRFLLLSQHGGLAHIEAGDARNPVDVLQRAVAVAMQEGAIPARDPALITAMIVGVVVQVATFILYGRLPGTMMERQDSLVAACRQLAGC